MNTKTFKPLGRIFNRWYSCSTLLTLALVSTPVYASVITLDLTTDIFAGSVSSTTDVNGFAGERWFSAPISFSPITIAQGDQLNLNVQFAPGQRIQLASGNFFSGNENIGFRENPIPGISLSGVSTLTAFLGLAGDFDATLPITTNFSTGGQLSGTVVDNMMTDTAFSYGGFSLNTTYTTLSGGPVTLSSLNLYASAEDISLLTVDIPEPAPLTLMGLGLMGLGLLRRKGNKYRLVFNSRD